MIQLADSVGFGGLRVKSSSDIIDLRKRQYDIVKIGSIWTEQ